MDKASEAILSYGVSEVSTNDLLSVLFRSGEVGEALSAVSLRWIEKASVKELCDLPSIGKKRAVALKAALALGRRLCETPLERGVKLSSSRQVFDAFKHKIGPLEHETFWVVLLNARNQVIKEVQISQGDLISCPVHPREVFRTAIKEGAVGIIILHNHPSGDVEPSPEDIELTHRLVSVGETVGISVLDHVVVCEQSYASLADRGLLSPCSF